MQIGNQQYPFLDLSKYHFTDSDQTVPSNSFFGYVSTDGAWVIMNLTMSDTKCRYASGSNNYTSNWTNRASLGYDYLFNCRLY